MATAVVVPASLMNVQNATQCRLNCKCNRSIAPTSEHLISFITATGNFLSYSRKWLRQVNICCDTREFGCHWRADSVLISASQTLGNTARHASCSASAATPRRAVGRYGRPHVPPPPPPLASGTGTMHSGASSLPAALLWAASSSAAMSELHDSDLCTNCLNSGLELGSLFGGGSCSNKLWEPRPARVPTTRQQRCTTIIMSSNGKACLCGRHRPQAPAPVRPHYWSQRRQLHLRQKHSTTAI